MPNGVMTGNGSQANPWIVEDGWDLNELRNLPTSLQWVELGNDINLSMFPNWIPIPQRALNFNGRGHIISDLSIQSPHGSCGLFAGLWTHEVRDVTIEGEMVCMPGNNQGVGLFCGELGFPTVANNPAGSTLVISNVQCFGSITATITSSAGGVGGCIGRVFGETNVAINISNCSFYGHIMFHASGASSTAPSATQFRVCAGILGDGASRAGTNNLSLNISDCMVVARFTAMGGVAHVGVSGILGGCRNVISGSVSRCIAQSRLEFANVAAIAQPIWYGGITSMSVNPVAVANCGAINEIFYNPIESVAGLHMAGLHCMRTTGTSNITTSYSTMSFMNPNGVALPTTQSMRGIGGNVTVANSFFDSQVLAQGWSGAVVGPEFGRTTAQLQSRAFLESQGWVFANV